MFPLKIKKILKKKNKKKIICLTSYSKNIAQILDKYCDIVLVGDSLGSVLYNYNTTRKISLNTMIEHSKSVRLGIRKSLMIVDMPYKTYRNKSEALRNCQKVMKETKCDGVKLEGGIKIKSIAGITTGIPIKIVAGIMAEMITKIIGGINSWNKNENYS